MCYFLDLFMLLLSHLALTLPFSTPFSLNQNIECVNIIDSAVGCACFVFLSPVTNELLNFKNNRLKFKLLKFLSLTIPLPWSVLSSENVHHSIYSYNYNKVKSYL